MDENVLQYNQEKNLVCAPEKHTTLVVQTLVPPVSKAKSSSNIVVNSDWFYLRSGVSNSSPNTTFRYIRAPTHLNEMTELPPQHVIKVCRGLVASHVFDSGCSSVGPLPILSCFNFFRRIMG
ncbi:hypothetical protein CHARACLAT_031149 [Characodon lateralis]|uniref:Uncharacterized protein n=1 Tax=Characodon lateralis TaxID=208331 RepID=A0ABU7D269_9TELE|nr:hypothetical protein [Characodon lateralis]